MDKQLQDYFKDYPKSNEVFQTSDGYLFHTDGDASLHAKTRPEGERGVDRTARPTAEAPAQVSAPAKLEAAAPPPTKTDEQPAKQEEKK